MADKTVTVLINGDGTMEFNQMGFKGKDCENSIKELINAMGEEKKLVRKPEYYKDEKVQIKQRF